MPIRQIIEIDEKLCNGCGDCITACAEGAIELVDGKAKLVKDIYCDGLGACLGHCPQGALQIVERESEDFDEQAVEARLAELATRSSNEPGPVPLSELAPSQMPMHGHGGGCPGSRTMSFQESPGLSAPGQAEGDAPQISALRQWPVQLHLVPPTAPFFDGADVLLAADCVAYAVAGFHQRFLRDHALAIACPKLDSHQEIYLEKLVSMIDHGGISSLTVMIMEVPCCSGLRHMAQLAAQNASREVPIRCLVVGVRGEVLSGQTFTVGT